MTEEEDFDRQILERIQHGYIPDIRNLKRVDYFYNNMWREPRFFEIYFLPKIKYVLSHIEGINVLEVGCGPGYLSLEIARMGKNVLGIDYSCESIKVAKKYGEKYPNLKYECVDYFKFKTRQKFDTIIFFRSLHHMDIDAAIKKTIDLLVDQGTLIICEPIRAEFTYENALFALLLRLALQTNITYKDKIKLLDEHSLVDLQKNIYEEYKYLGNFKQSDNDKNITFDDIYRILRKNFNIQDFILEDSVIEKIIGSLRGSYRFEAAEMLKKIDEKLVRENFLKPTSVSLVAKKR
ncbi:MAG TPA: class I SAM-dependent methyltransferase [Candidatus Atribacteria bacterium]|nr:class I SAM-dependent methyltransferase [Candidatus Atribacteria bacterium]